MAETGSTAQAANTGWDRGLVSGQSAVQLVRASYERSGVDVDEYALRAIRYCESGTENTRRELARRRVNILKDATAPLIRAALKNWLTDAVFDAVTGKNGDHIDITRNPAKRIWEDMASLYSRPPLRTTKRKTDINAYLELLKGTKFDSFWQAVEARLQACNQVLIWPDVVTDSSGKKTVKHRYATPDTFSVIANEDDATRIEAIILIDKWVDIAGTARCRYILWSDKWHAQYEPDGYDDDGKLKVKRTGQLDEDLETFANPYGRMVQTLLSKEYLNDELLDQTSGEDLVNLTVGNGERRCILRYTEKMSGFKSILATGSSVDKPPQSLLDPAAVSVLEGGEVKATLVDWQVDLEKQQKVFDRDEERAAASRGINAQLYKAGGDYQNATVAKGAERGLTERRIHDAPIYIDGEASYALDLSLVARTHGVKDPPAKDIELEVMHAPIEYPTDPKAQSEIDKTDISLGLASAVTICQRRHPTWDVKKCEKFIAENMETTAKINEVKVKRNLPDNPENESASAEDNGRMGGRPPVGDNQEPTKTPPGAVPGIPNSPQENA